MQLVRYVFGAAQAPVRAVILAFVLVATGLASAPAHAATAPLAWGAPILADDHAPFSTGQPLAGVSCPTTSFCAAVEEKGRVATTSTPTSSDRRDWKITEVDQTAFDAAGGQTTAISCASPTLCAVVDTNGHVIVSTDPTGGRNAWHAISTPGGILLDISCTSSGATSVCIAVNHGGDYVISHDPADGASSTWTLGHYDSGGGGGFSAGVSCPDTTLCVITDSGSTFTSANPTATTPTWTPKVVDAASTDSFRTISCPTTSLCVALKQGSGGFGNGNVAISTDPADGANATWATRDIDGMNSMLGVSCSTTPVCVVTDFSGNLLSTSDPTDGANAVWHTTAEGADKLLAGVSCRAGMTSLCVIAGGSGNAGSVFTSTSPDSGSWATTEVDGWNPLGGMSCPSTTLCVGSDAAGNVVTSGDPTSTDASGSAWTASNVDGTAGMGAISCASPALCVAVDVHGDIVTSTTPTNGGSWTAASIAGTFLTSVSCTSDPTPLCVATDGTGDALSSTTPTDASSWHVKHVIDDINHLDGVSCASTSLCVAVDGDGNVLTSANAGQGTTATWAVKNIGVGFTGVSCPSAALCVGVDGTGDVSTSTDPADGASAQWSTFSVTPSFLYAVSCSPGPQTQCAAGTNGVILNSTDPADASSWAAVSLTPLDQQTIDPIISISCQSAALCVAGDSLGNTIAGTTPPPDTTITSHSPTDTLTNSASAQFSFSSDTPGATFECRLTSAGTVGSWSGCSPPKSYSSLADGSYTFEVRAVNGAVTDPTPASFGWTVDTAAPDTTIDTHPANPTNSTSAAFTYHSSDASGDSFECSLDGASFVTCPASYTALADGPHTFQVRARDGAANVDSTPASFTWTVDATAPDTTIDSGPGNFGSSATFTYHSSDASGDTFHCSLDGAASGPCPTSSPNYTGLSTGSHTFTVFATDAAGNADPTPASVAWESVAASGGTVSSGSDANATTPVTVAVTVPASAGGGNVTIETAPVTTTSPTGYSAPFGQQVSISAPTATPASPLRLVFTIDASAIPQGTATSSITMLRTEAGGSPQPLPDCADTTGQANPDPCVRSREVVGGGDVRLTVLTSQASTWNFTSALSSGGAGPGGGSTPGTTSTGTTPGPTTPPTTTPPPTTSTTTTTSPGTGATCVVPKLKGKTLAQAKKLLVKAHCKLGKVTQKKGKGKKGTVVSSKPAVGAQRPAGAKIALVVRR